MPSLLQTLKISFPKSPSPPEPKLVAISTALDNAVRIHITSVFSPGIGATFLSFVPEPTPFISSLSAHLDLTISPIISAALVASNVPGSTRETAWASIQPSFDALALAVPPFIAGTLGSGFWTAVLTTIRTGITPA